jgi:anti-sigma factor RsiW
LLALGLLVVGRGVRGTPWRAADALAAQDEIARLEADLRGASRALTGHSRVLYASSVPNGSLKTLGFEEQTRRFFIAQYALAPRVVILVGRPGRVFGDFAGPGELQAYAAEHGYRLLWSRGGLGVMEQPR